MMKRSKADRWFEILMLATICMSKIITAAALVMIGIKRLFY
jgi:hypothetical protein